MKLHSSNLNDIARRERRRETITKTAESNVLPSKTS